MDLKKQQIIGPHNKVQVMFARGLFDNWKLPIYFDFDQDMTINILHEAISKLYECGFIVVAMVSDLGSTNRKLQKQLEVCPSNPSFPYPSIPDGKVFVFCDVPHLIKLVRNHFIDQDFILADGRYIDKTPLEKLVELQTQNHLKGLKTGWKLNSSILQVKGNERQCVKSATKLLSRNVAQAILWAGDSNLLGNCEYKLTASFINLINSWFDILNSSMKYGHHPGSNAYGVDLDVQNKILNDVSNIIEGMVVKSHNTLQPFQHGILLTNASIQGIFSYLKQNFNISYLITKRFNQDILETLRGMGCNFDNPIPLEFIYRLRKYILCKHSSTVFTLHTNCKEDTTNKENIVTPSSLSTITTDEPEIVLTQCIFDAIIDDTSLNAELELEESIKVQKEGCLSIGRISKAGLIYLAG
ncbi:unnamed protein product [Macrosiphum euphorbiae]|uniref:Transposable element P transposase n=1 Tax=Macrosiphum euphorbiae TaxID=13131 RepID=A0AAV0WVQ5_9HEMI|nr:unnamed protein product [Macrosiphum euphorbiae]